MNHDRLVGRGIFSRLHRLTLRPVVSEQDEFSLSSSFDEDDTLLCPVEESSVLSVVSLLKLVPASCLSLSE